MKSQAGKYADLIMGMDNFGSVPLPSPYKWKQVSKDQKPRNETLFGICGACMQRDCATLVHLEDGIVRKVEGNPDAPPNFGTLCPKGNAAVLGHYNPYRVKAPMVRTNPEKGLDVDPKWKEVSWDDALDLVAEKLRPIMEKDPRGFVMCEGWGDRDSILRGPFMKAFGSPNYMGSHGPLCTVHYASCLVQAGFPVAIVDLEHCNYHVTLGRSLGPNFSTNTSIRKLAKALDRGMKLVVVDPRCSPEAAKGEWVPIRPGSDLAFLLGMAHVMIHEIKIFDEWFLKRRTNAPYLIGEDGNYAPHAESGKPMIWDETDNIPKCFDEAIGEPALEGKYRYRGQTLRPGFDLIKEEFARYTPEWAETICTVNPETIRRIAREFVDHAQIGAAIDIDGFTFPFRPVSLNVERNVTNHRGGTYADLTGKIINMLVGSIEVPGGCLTNGPRGHYLAPGDDGVVKPAFEAVGHPFKFPPDHIDCTEFYPNKHQAPHLAARAILNPGKYHHDYEVKAWLSSGSNVIRKTAQPEMWVEVFRKIPFSVALAYHFDEQAVMSDVLLPAPDFMERKRVEAFHRQHQAMDDEVNGLHMIQYRQTVPMVFNCRHTDDIMTGLAKRLGILQGEGGVYDLLNNTLDFLSEEDGLNLKGEQKLDLDRTYTLDEIFDRQVKCWKYNTEGLGLTDLDKTGFLARRVPIKEFYNYYYYPGEKTRHPFYFNHLKAVGDRLRSDLKEANLDFPGIDDPEYIFDLYKPIPHWVLPSEYETQKEYDLWAFNWKTVFYSHDHENLTGHPWLAELYKNDPTEGTICLNSETARRKGLSEGDRVVVESRYGKVEGRVHASDIFHPDALGISGCYGLGTPGMNPQSRQGPHFNTLMPMDDASLDAVSAGMEVAPKVRVYRKEGSA